MSFVIEATLEQMRGDYDWEQVFGAANGGNHSEAERKKIEEKGYYPTTIYNIGVPYLVGDDETPQPTFGVDDVEKVLGSVEGENDAEDWVALLKLKDGRYALVAGGCDYTGWD